MERRFVDTNIFLRFLTADDPETYQSCRELFERAVAGKVTLVTSGIVIAELIWTLQSFYEVPKADIVEKVAIIANMDHLEIPDKNIISNALILFGREPIDYIDAYNAALMEYSGLRTVFSYDKDFDRIGGLQRLEP